MSHDVEIPVDGLSEVPRHAGNAGSNTYLAPSVGRQADSPDVDECESSHMVAAYVFIANALLLWMILAQVLHHLVLSEEIRPEWLSLSISHAIILAMFLGTQVFGAILTEEPVPH